MRPGSASARPLSVADVRFLIHTAGLSQKQLAEKFVQIRFDLQGVMRQPQPSWKHVRAIESDYADIVRVWESDENVRGGRSNIINLNFIIATLILRNGGDALYAAHIDDFPTVGKTKWTQLFRMLHHICMRIGWKYMPCPVSSLPRCVNATATAARGNLRGGSN